MDSIGKRMYRNLGDDTKAKISQSLRGTSNTKYSYQQKGMLLYII